MDSLTVNRGYLLLSKVPQAYIVARVDMFRSAIRNKGGAMNKCIEIMDGTVVDLARRSEYMQKFVLCNGHKRKQALKIPSYNHT